MLRGAISDSRLVVAHDSAENVQEILESRGTFRADYIVSGVPLGSMPSWMQSAIAIASKDALDERGKFLVYQFTSRVLPVPI